MDGSSFLQELRNSSHMTPRLLLAASVFLAGTVSLSAQTTPSFELNLDSYSAYGANGVAQGDFNGDGKADLVLGGGASNTTITLRLGNGDGTFRAPITVGQADSAQVLDVVAADLNSDGKLDVVALCIGGTFDVFYGYGDGTFQPPVVVVTGSSPRGIAVGNFYKDGLLDVAIGDVNGYVELFKNMGGRTFVGTAGIQVEPNKEILKVRPGDVDADGNVDLGVVTTDSSYVLWGDGKGGFSPVLLRKYQYAAPVDLNVADVNQDGISDVVVAYNCSSSVQDAYTPECAGFDVFYGQGNRKIFYRHAVSQPGITAQYPLAADVNGDGIADLVATGRSDNNNLTGLFVWMGHPDGSFDQTAQQFIAQSCCGAAIVAGDWNRDGMIDFAQSMPSSAQMEIYINGGNRAACATSAINPTVTVCQPVDGTYSPSPVRVQATTFDTTPVTALQEYVDNKLLYSADVKQFDRTFTEGVGSHFFVTKAFDAKGVSFRSNRYVTVYSGIPWPACPAALGTANICLPSGTSSSSPVHILANAYAANVPSAVQLYVDGSLVVNNTHGSTSYLDTNRTLAKGTHELVFKLYDASGNVYVAQKSVTVQ
jgi:hypothetical protein